jgi:hypothetical protein
VKIFSSTTDIWNVGDVFLLYEFRKILEINNHDICMAMSVRLFRRLEVQRRYVTDAGEGISSIATLEWSIAWVKKFAKTAIFACKLGY